MVEFDKSASEPPSEGQPPHQNGGQQQGQQGQQGQQPYGQPYPQQGQQPYGQPQGQQPGYGYPAPPPGPGQQPPYGGPGGPGAPGWGSQPPGYGYATPPRPSTGPAMWSHLGAVLTVFVGTGVCCIGMLCGWIAPMAIRNNAQNEHDPYIRHHAAQGMNYGITQAIMAVITGILYFVVVISAGVTADSGTGDPGLVFFIPLICYFVLFGAYWITTLVFGIIGAVKANNGQMWSYPKFLSWRFVKN
ncbi:DUF4870 domain-containing protein [Streptomyces violens]|uniref:DUF4870 domain-containing protein n=1 Tax=Streptomyces violens TaxID=66377 RepID=UPI00068F9039|nr:DUF4870 domain-containing protein [Streptomyces violens]